MRLPSGEDRPAVERRQRRGSGGCRSGANHRPTGHRATVALSTLVGALLLARAVDDEALSAEILGDVRNAVKATPLS
jgi:hypothetical protein